MALRSRLRPAWLRVVGSDAASEWPRPDFDDAQILAAVRNGDRAAATSLYRRARPQVDRTLIRLLGRRDRDHEDLVQLSMIALVESIPRFRGDCSLDTWVGRIAAHTLYNELRRRSSERRMLEEAAREAEAAPPASGPDRSLHARSLLHRIREHLAAIDPVKAWTVLLHDVAGHDLREIAEITGATVAAAQSRLVRGRGELQRRIETDPDLAARLEEGNHE